MINTLIGFYINSSVKNDDNFLPWNELYIM